MRAIGDRIRQFREAGAEPTAGDMALARRWLDGELLALFEGQHPREMVHGAATARWLLERGESDGDLLRAALLHDVAKGEQRRLDRVLWVMLDGAGVAERVAGARSRWGWRRALARTAAHAEEGAAVLAGAGAPARVVELTLLHHAEAGGDAMLSLLQRADAAS